MAGKKKPGIPVKSINIKLRMINDLIDVTGSAKDSWNPAEISDDMKAIAYIRDLADTWNPAQLNEALKYLGFATIDSWNPAIIEETKNKLVKYFLPTNSSGNPIELDLKGLLPYEVTSLTIDLLPIQDLSHGEPSPTNICPISGRTQASVVRTGKNLVDIDEIVEGKMLTTTDGTLENGTNKLYVTDYIYVVKGVPVFIPATGTSRRWFYDLNKVGSVYINYAYQQAYIPPENGYIRVTATTDIIAKDELQIEYGTTASTYEPYNGETVTVQFGQTVYGGNVNVLEGGTSSTYGYIASYDGEELPGAWISDRDAYAAGTDPTTGAEVVYILTTPTELTTPANEIALVNGENTLSTDGDNINITYKAILNS